MSASVFFFSRKCIPKEPRRSEWPTDKVCTAPMLQSPQEGPAGGGCGPCSPARTWTLEFPPRCWEALTLYICDPKTKCALIAAAVVPQPGLAGWDGCWIAASYLQGCLVKAFGKHFHGRKSCLIVSPPTPSHKHLCVALPRRCFPMARSA